MSPATSIELLDGTRVSWMAFGTGSALNKQDCTDACKLALSSAGFRHIDTAQMYENEDCVGRAIASSGVPRDSLYVTTKLNVIPPGQTVEDTLLESLKKLQLEYVDLFLIHIPVPHMSREGGLKQVWREMVDVKRKGLARSIGVSNFNKAHLEEIISIGLDKPVVNQIEYHPLLATRLAPLATYMREQGIVIESYATLSPILPHRIADDSIKPILVKLTATLDELGRTRGTSVTQNQILFKWLQAQGAIAVTTSNKELRLKECLAAESLPDLTGEEIQAIEDSVAGADHRFFPNYFLDIDQSLEN